MTTDQKVAAIADYLEIDQNKLTALSDSEIVYHRPFIRQRYTPEQWAVSRVIKLPITLTKSEYQKIERQFKALMKIDELCHTQKFAPY